MSAVEEYEIRKGEMTLQEMSRADAAIAELEYELETARMMMRASTAQAYKERLEQAEADLEVSQDSAADLARMLRRAESALAERDYFIDSLYSESGIPTRHWRDTITRCVTDLRARAEEGSGDE